MERKKRRRCLRRYELNVVPSPGFYRQFIVEWQVEAYMYTFARTSEKEEEKRKGERRKRWRKRKRWRSGL